MSKSNRFFEALEAERETYGTPNVLHDIGYINGLTMAKIIAIKTDAISVVRCENCEYCYKSSFSSTGYRCKQYKDAELAEAKLCAECFGGSVESYLLSESYPCSNYDNGMCVIDRKDCAGSYCPAWKERYEWQ